MLSARACLTFLLAIALAVTPSFASSTHHTATSKHHHRHHRGHVKKVRRHIIRGQRSIDSERAKEIQEALIKQNYLTGPASGEWDATTEKAMQKFQADHGWQTKLTPDSRALIMLGLGPAHSDESAPVDGPALVSAQSNPAPVENTLASTHIIQN